MKRLAVLLLVAVSMLGALGSASAVWAKPFAISVTQIVEHPALDATRKGFEDGLKELGVEATLTVHIAQGNIATANQIASQIQGEKPDLILAIATPTAQAVVQKIKDIPILATAVTDFVGAGLVNNMEKPGANVSGMTDLTPMDKHVALAKEFLPELKTLGVIYNAGEANSVTLANLLKAEAKKLGVAVEEATVANSAGVMAAAKSLVGRCQAIYVPTDNTVVSALESVLKVGADNKLPVFSGDTDSVERGTMASLGFDYYGMGKQTAGMAKKILADGVKAGDLPVEMLNELKLFINKKAAASFGVTIPEPLLARAAKVIE
ncbi:ABC transporter substrate-binding protein [Megalodesulfovibrio paquesii]